MRGGLVDFGRLIILILFLPLILIVIGPLLILAVLRGKQQVGPITLNAARYDSLGRAGIFMLGLAAWILVWGSLGWLALAATAPVQTTVVELPQADQINSVGDTATPTQTATRAPATPSPTADRATGTPAAVTSPAVETVVAASTVLTATRGSTSTLTLTPLSTATSTTTTTPTATPSSTSTSTSTPTPTVPTNTPTPSPSPTQTPSPTATETDTPTATATATPTFTYTPSPSPTHTPTSTATNTATATATNSPTPTFTFTPSPTSTNSPTNTATPTATNTGTPTPIPTLVAGERQAVLSTVRNGNEALRRTIESANEENLEELEAFWAGRALEEVAAFAIDTNERYSNQFTVVFEYIRQPFISSQISTRQVFVTSQERWTYGGPTTATEELFEFIYTLSRRGDGWIITNFGFRDMKSPTPTLVPPRRPASTSTPSSESDDN